MTPQQILEFRKKYGIQSGQYIPEKSDKPGYFARVASAFTGLPGRIVSDIGKSTEQVAGGILDVEKGKPLIGALGVAKGLGRSALRTVGGITGAAISPITEAVAPVIEPIMRKEIEAQPELYKKISELTQKHPELTRDFEDILNIATFGAVKTVTKPVISAVSKATGEVAEAVGGVLKEVPEYAISRMPKLLGIFSGEGDDVIRAALKNPEAANLGIRQGDVALRKAVTEGAENSIKIRRAFTTAHSQVKKKVFGESLKVLVPRNDVVGEFNKLLIENGVKLKNGVMDFTTSLIKANPGEMSKIKDAYSALRKWDKFTIESLDEYKQLVGKLTKFATEAGVPSKSPFLGRFYNKLNEIAASKLPKDLAGEYMATNKKFSTLIEMYDDVVDAFNSGDPFTKIAGILGKNKDTLRSVIEFYEKKTGKQISPIVAGRELAMEKTAAFGFLNPRSWIDFFISPAKQGEIITKIGSMFYKK